MTRPAYTLTDLSRDAALARDAWYRATSGWLGRADKRLRADEAYRRAITDNALRYASGSAEQELADNRDALASTQRRYERAVRDHTAAERALEAVTSENTHLRAALAALQRKQDEHLCEPLPQRVRKLPTATPEPSPATEAPPNGAEKPAKPRSARSAGTGRAKPAQAVTGPQGVAGN